METWGDDATAGTGGALVHCALMYDDEGEFLAATVPFLHSGMAAGDAMLAVVPQPRIDALRRALGPDSAAVQFIDAIGWYQHPVHTIAAYDAFLRAQAPQRVCALTEPVWQGRSPLEVVEWARYEAIVNAAFDNSGASAMCAYDRSVLGPEVLEGALRTHPELLDGPGTHQHSHTYVDPAGFSAACDREPLRLPSCFDSVSFESADLHDVRRFVTDRSLRYGVPNATLGNLLVAVTEVATNAINHGTPPMAVRIWAEDDALICEIADCGFWRPTGLLGFLPPESATTTGFGLWGVRMLTDLVQIRTGWDGTVVRMSTKL
jgi:anti-sigma regulatory factor (Ser/Thr protein kinase)